MADLGKTIARQIGNKLILGNNASEYEVRCLETIVENACLIHDIGNPPFGHFGEEAIKKWFSEKAPKLHEEKKGQLHLGHKDERLYDLLNFDGNPQGFRIVNRLHNELDEYGLNLTHGTLLASIKYPCFSKETKESGAYKKLGVFSSESEIYELICNETNHQNGKRYFAVYLMELADDICYCLSDIADAFEKRVIDSRMFKDEIKKVFKEENADLSLIEDLIPNGPIIAFSHQIAIKVSQKCVKSAVDYFLKHLDSFINGEEGEIVDSIPEGQILKCLKKFSRRFIYTAPEAQRIEVAGHKIVHGLLDHFGSLLKVDKDNFSHFIRKQEMKKDSGLDIEWRIYNQLSKRMIQTYRTNLRYSEDDEWFKRCRLITDYISGMTDPFALQVYQNSMGISLDQ